MTVTTALGLVKCELESFYNFGLDFIATYLQKLLGSGDYIDMKEDASMPL